MESLEKTPVRPYCLHLSFFWHSSFHPCKALKHVNGDMCQRGFQLFWHLWVPWNWFSHRYGIQPASMCGYKHLYCWKCKAFKLGVLNIRHTGWIRHEKALCRPIPLIPYPGTCRLLPTYSFSCWLICSSWWLAIWWYAGNISCLTICTWAVCCTLCVLWLLFTIQHWWNTCSTSTKRPLVWVGQCTCVGENYCEYMQINVLMWALDSRMKVNVLWNCLKL